MYLIKTSSFGHVHQDSVASTEIRAKDGAILEGKRGGGKEQITHAGLQGCVPQHLHCQAAKQTTCI